MSASFLMFALFLLSHFQTSKQDPLTDLENIKEVMSDDEMALIFLDEFHEPHEDTFKRIDANGNGKLSALEILAYDKEMADTIQNRVLGAYDKNGDKVVSKDEFDKEWKEIEDKMNEMVIANQSNYMRPFITAAKLNEEETSKLLHHPPYVIQYLTDFDLTKQFKTSDANNDKLLDTSELDTLITSNDLGKCHCQPITSLPDKSAGDAIGTVSFELTFPHRWNWYFGMEDAPHLTDPSAKSACKMEATVRCTATNCTSTDGCTLRLALVGRNGTEIDTTDEIAAEKGASVATVLFCDTVTKHWVAYNRMDEFDLYYKSITESMRGDIYHPMPSDEPMPMFDPADGIVAAIDC